MHLSVLYQAQLWLIIPSMVMAACPPGVIEVPLQRIKNQSAYGVEIHLGNPPQKVITSADSGSPTYGFESPINPVCQRGLCQAYGTYDNTTSETVKWLNDGYNNMLNDQGFGSFMNDTLRIGGITLENMMFGVVETNLAHFEITGQQAAIFGLGAQCQTKACDGYPTFMQQLYDRGAISRRAFSVYLGPNDPDARGTILFGGIDRAKRQGPVYKFNVQDPTEPSANEQPNYVKQFGMNLKLANGTEITHKYDNGTYALWDSGNPTFNLPADIFDTLMDYWGRHNVSIEENPVTVDCKFRRPSEDTISVDFGQGVKIDVPVHTIPVQYEDGTCAASVAPFDSGNGDPFLRQVYFTFDYDNLTIEFAAVKFTDETDIVKIE